MRLLGYSGWLLGVAMRLQGYPGWLLRCCYVVARVLGVVARGVAKRLLGYTGWLLGSLLGYPGMVAKVLLCGC